MVVSRIVDEQLGMERNPPLTCDAGFHKCKKCLSYGDFAYMTFGEQSTVLLDLLTTINITGGPTVN